MPYRIGDVVSLLSLTREAIRAYENKEIIAPRRDDQSGYRYYDLTDLGALIRVRRYRTYGFNLDEIAQMLNDLDTPQIVERLMERAAQIRCEIEEKERLLDCLNKWTSIVRGIPDGIDRFTIEYSPELYVIALTDGERLVDGKYARSRLREWVDREPFVFSVGKWIIQEDGCSNDCPQMFLCAEARDMERLGIDRSTPVEYWPSRRCIHTVIMRESESENQWEGVEPALDYAGKHNYRICGAPFIRTIMLAHKSTSSKIYRDLWIPIEE